MAMRPQGGLGGIRATAGYPVFRRPVFEDFRPFSEWKHVEGADVLLIHLPGFMKENLKITSELSNMIKVRGERMLANSTWSRFSQDFRIPEYCNVAGISARFEDGILYITMAINKAPTTPKAEANPETQSPKTTTTEPRKSPEEEESTKVRATKTGQFEKDTAQVQTEMRASPQSAATDKDPSRITRKENATTPKAEEIGAQSEKNVESKTTEKVASAPPKPENSTENRTPPKQKITGLVEEVKSKLQKSVEDIKTGVAKSSAQKAEQDRTNAENMESVPTSKQRTTELIENVKSKLQKGIDDIKTSVAKSSAQKIEQDQTNPTKDEYKGTNVETINKEKERMKKINEDFTHEAEFLKKHLKKPEKDNNDSSNSHEKEDANQDITQTGEKGEDQLEKYKKIVADFAMKIKDDRESVVNIGAAVLVLVSLGVYISYTTFGNVSN